MPKQIILIRHADASNETFKNLKLSITEKLVDLDPDSKEFQETAREVFFYTSKYILGIKASLSEEGIEAAKALPAFGDEPSKIFISSSPRTYQTAQHLFNNKGWGDWGTIQFQKFFTKLEPRATLDELNGGLRDLCLSPEMLFALVPGEKERYELGKKYNHWHYKNCGGESLCEMVTRLVILARELDEIPDEEIVWVVGHGRSLRGLLYHLLGWSGSKDWFDFEKKYGNPPLLGRITLVRDPDSPLGLDHKIQDMSWTPNN